VWECPGSLSLDNNSFLKPHLASASPGISAFLVLFIDNPPSEKSVGPTLPLLARIFVAIVPNTHSSAPSPPPPPHPQLFHPTAFFTSLPPRAPPHYPSVPRSCKNKFHIFRLFFTPPLLTVIFTSHTPLSPPQPPRSHVCCTMCGVCLFQTAQPPAVVLSPLFPTKSRAFALSSQLPLFQTPQYFFSVPTTPLTRTQAFFQPRPNRALGPPLEGAEQIPKVPHTTPTTSSFFPCR